MITTHNTIMIQLIGNQQWIQNAFTFLAILFRVLNTAGSAKQVTSG
jgi:hypothetical protein